MYEADIKACVDLLVYENLMMEAISKKITAMVILTGIIAVTQAIQTGLWLLA